MSDNLYIMKLYRGAAESGCVLLKDNDETDALPVQPSPACSLNRLFTIMGKLRRMKKKI